jgi:hypothetical protein
MSLELSKKSNYALDVEMKNGFKYSLYVRGYEAQSMIDFTNSLTWTKSVEPRYLTKEEFDDIMIKPIEDSPEDKPVKRKRKPKNVQE